ncbi:MAG TPA: hypothetical protein VGQ62_07400, partial [Chloroflexota bacterium]|nr:hypothetical protein [Chloroflexota bacterium]
VIAIDEVGRYRVRLADGSLVTLDPTQVSIVAAPDALPGSSQTAQTLPTAEPSPQDTLLVVSNAAASVLPDSDADRAEPTAISPVDGSQAMSDTAIDVVSNGEQDTDTPASPN